MSSSTGLRASILPLLVLAALLASTCLAATAAPRAVAAQAEDEGELFIDGDEAEVEISEDDLGEEAELLDDEGFEDESFDDDFAADEEAVDGDVAAIEAATGELGRAKRAGAAKVARLARGGDALAACTRGGPGWKRIRAVGHPSQRALYSAAARRLLADMRLLLDVQQPRIVAYEGAFARFVADLRGAGVEDPTLREAIAAQGRRLAAYRDVRSVKASCQVFNRLTRAVREFPTRSAAQIVRADYRAAPIARRIERAISNRLARIDRRHGIAHRDAETLADAAETMVELGGEQGYATGFQYALSLR